MPASKQFYFRPVRIQFTETSYSTVGIFYRLDATVNFYADPEMNRLSHSQEMAFDNVPFNPTWE